MSTHKCCFELVGLLLSLSIYHPNENIFIISDSKTKVEIEKITPQPKLNIVWFVELDSYSDMDRFTMDKKGIFGEFLKNKMKIINYALKQNNDTLLLDSDIIITDIIDDIDSTKDVGLSPQFIDQEYINKTGFYNAGMLWCKSTIVSDYWCSIIDNLNSCPEQINMIKLRKFNYFEFEENYNLQCWRYYLPPGGKQQIEYNIDSKPNDKLYYKNKPLKFVHTHFLDGRFKNFNQLFIQHLYNSNNYKILLIIFRVIHNKWIIKIPKQPIQGLGNHKNDSFRELPILYKMNNFDVDLQYIENSIHCWLHPNILLYDRPTLQWINNEVNNTSLFLLGNGDVEIEGKLLNQKFKNLNISSWIFWPRHAMILEKTLKTHSIKSYNDRSFLSIFIGNIENNTQDLYRKDDNWKDVITEFYCTKGQNHLFKQEEYLMKLRDAKFGLCLRGYGSKCHREVELMAFGTIPIITPNVSVQSFMEPLIENTHYIFVKNPQELDEKLKLISQDHWEKMSQNCFEWYQRNVHSKNAWNTMISRILYNL